MTAKMTSTNNKSFEYLLDKHGTLTISNTINITYPDGRWFHTSKVQNIVYDRQDAYTDLKVKTKNSLYTFRIADDNN